MKVDEMPMLEFIGHQCRVRFALAIAIALILPNLRAQTPSDLIPEYKPIHAASGVIRVCGSPQMRQLLKLYQSGFATEQPDVRFTDKLDSTLTAVSEIAASHADVGMLGRELWPSEARAFTAVAGHPPLAVKIAIGSYDVPKATYALMIFVPRANPLAALSLNQLERIFAASDTAFHTWGELGLKGSWVDRPIHLYGFAKGNDKAQIFRRLIFKHGETWSAALKEFSNEPEPGGADAGELILRAVASDPGAIGISNVHYATPAVKALPLSAAGSLLVAPSRDAIAAGKYPLARAVYMIIDPAILARSNPKPVTGKAVAEFLRYVLSRQGASAVRDEGNYIPLTPSMAQQGVHSLPLASADF